MYICSRVFDTADGFPIAIVTSLTRVAGLQRNFQPNCISKNHTNHLKLLLLQKNQELEKKTTFVFYNLQDFYERQCPCGAHTILMYRHYSLHNNNPPFLLPTFAIRLRNHSVRHRHNIYPWKNCIKYSFLTVIYI